MGRSTVGGANIESIGGCKGRGRRRECGSSGEAGWGRLEGAREL